MNACLETMTSRGAVEAVRGALSFQRIVLGCFLLVGCAGVFQGYEGTPARPDNRLALAAMSDKAAVWQAKDLAIHYTAKVASGELRISGSVERMNTIKHFTGINYLRINIHFLTNEGIIIASKLLWSSGTGVDATIIPWTFDQQFPLPPGAEAIGFSYRGAFSEGTGESSGQIGWEVWQGP